MTIIELLRDPATSLPLSVDPKLPYRDQLAAALNGFLARAAAVKDGDPVSGALIAAVPRMRELANHLLAVHDAVLLGRPGVARTHMEAAVAQVRQEVDRTLSVPVSHAQVGTLFRLRVADPSEGIDRGGMFHIPYERREIVGPQRFSLLGVPMLYLGSTLFICWEEMGRPPLERTWVSALKLRDGCAMRVLNLAYRPRTTAGLLEATGLQNAEANDIALARTILWPLLAACSFRRRHATPAFAEEYIIPQQLVALFAESDDIDGVRYFSNRHAADLSSDTLVANFALLARPDAAQNVGYSPRLTDLFTMTPPMPYSMVLRLGPKLNQGDPFVGSRDGVLQAIVGHPVNYQFTELSRVEGHLEAQDYRPI